MALLGGNTITTLCTNYKELGHIKRPVATIMLLLYRATINVSHKAFLSVPIVQSRVTTSGAKNHQEPPQTGCGMFTKYLLSLVPKAWVRLCDSRTQVSMALWTKTLCLFSQHLCWHTMEFLNSKTWTVTDIPVTITNRYLGSSIN